MRKNWKPLLLIYGAAVALRFILALLCTQAPVVNIDEYLYMSIAKSLASSGEVLYSGQPADFSSLLYSVCLTPVYLLFRDGADYYRLLQLWSILLINLSVFPAFSLARELTGDRKTALLLSALTALTADFAFGAILMAECVIYPLTLTALWLGYRWLKEHRFSYALLIGVCLELLYEAKPGAVAVPAVLLVTMAAVLLRGKETKRLLQPLCGLAVAGAIFLVFRLLFGSASVYTQQLALPVGERLEAFGIALARMPAMFLLAGGFGAVLLPVMRIGKYTRADRCFLIAVLAALTVTVIGTAWIINRYESATRAVHIRYIAVYLPVFLFFTAIPVEGSAAGKKRGPCRKTASFFPCAHWVIPL